MDDSKVIFSRNLTRYMENAGKSRIDVCHDLGISYYTYTDWIKGKKLPRMNKVQMLAEYFGINVSDLIEEKPTAEMGDGLTVSQRKLFEIAKELPDDKAEILLQLMKSMLGEN